MTLYSLSVLMEMGEPILFKTPQLKLDCERDVWANYLLWFTSCSTSRQNFNMSL